MTPIEELTAYIYEVLCSEELNSANDDDGMQLLKKYNPRLWQLEKDWRGDLELM